MGGGAPGQAAGQAAGSPPTQSTTPFVFAGRMIDKTEVTLFLLGNNRPILAKVNDVIDGAYRVDKIGNASAVLTYLPTNTQQTVVFNSTAIGASALGGAAGRGMDGNPIDHAGIARQVVGIDSPNVVEQLKSR